MARGVGPLESLDLFLRTLQVQVQVQGRDRVRQVVGLGGADDGAATTGFRSTQARATCAMGTPWFSATFCTASAIGLVAVVEGPPADRIAVGPGGSRSPGSREPSLGERSSPEPAAHSEKE
jgi:hypothetical protein